MSISAARFEYALREMQSSDWERFERLSSIFLASEFLGLRTMTSPGGDLGRDAEIFSFGDAPLVMVQFSVREDWEQKIKETLKRLKENFPQFSALIFMTSQQVGAKADNIRRIAREQGIILDVRDRAWFVERLDSDDRRRNAAAELARVIVDPLLERSGVIQGAGGVKGQDAKTALVFLELQAHDDNTDRSLTKSCYESLVKAALCGTNMNNRMSREDIHKHIGIFLP